MGSAEAPILLTGGCQCGAVRYELTGRPRAGSICHCRMCQKAGGAPFMVFAGTRLQNFAFSHGEPAIYRSSDIAERGFCGFCGTPLTYRMIASKRISFTIGSLDAPESVEPSEQLGVESALPWFAKIHTLPGQTTQEWLDAAKIESVGNRQHPDHES